MENHQQKTSNDAKEWLVIIVMTLAIMYFIRTFIFSPFEIKGDSMNPTLSNEERVFVNKIEKYFNDFTYNDVIIFKGYHNEPYIKRIVAVPGDHVEFINQQLYINGVALTEPYIIPDKTQADISLQQLYAVDVIPDDYYFVLGDNRANSQDSRLRAIGLIHKDDITGTAEWVIWPLKKIRNVNAKK